jgi:hypothetical protein
MVREVELDGHERDDADRDWLVGRAVRCCGSGRSLLRLAAGNRLHNRLSTFLEIRGSFCISGALWDG